MTITLSNTEDAQNNVDENWAFLHTVVRMLGPEGMSSDESEVEEPGKRLPYKKCRARKRLWRAKELDPYLVLIDAERNYKNAFGNDLPGTKPRVRERSRRRPSMNSRVPPYLPFNFYDRKWYDGLTEKNKQELHPKLPMKMIEFEED